MPASLTLTPIDLGQLKTSQLDDLFQHGTVTEIPQGYWRGTMIIAPATIFTPLLATLVRLFVWQGKMFYPEQGTLINRGTPFHLSIEKADVYREKSWLDDKPAIIVDYTNTALVSRWIRDEIREVAPNLYLGLAYQRHSRKKILYFLLTADPKV